jgi:hypothetical protein
MGVCRVHILIPIIDSEGNATEQPSDAQRRQA